MMTQTIPRGRPRGRWSVAPAVTLLSLALGAAGSWAAHSWAAHSWAANSGAANSGAANSGAANSGAARPGAWDSRPLPPATASSEAPPAGRPKEFDYTAWNAFLAKYNKGGLVDYASLKKDGGKELDSIVYAMARHPYRSVFQKEARVAFLINAYNALTIQQALKAYPPTRPDGGPKDIPGFFDKTRHALDGGKYTLDQIETELLTPISPREPRYHLALCRAAVGTPPLRRNAFTADSLGLQLENLGALYAQDGARVRASAGSDTLFLPELFEWHRKDFEWGDQTLPRFMAPNFGLGVMMKMMQNEPIVVFQPLDWRLNDFRNAGSGQ